MAVAPRAQRAVTDPWMIFGCLSVTSPQRPAMPDGANAYRATAAAGSPVENGWPMEGRIKARPWRTGNGGKDSVRRRRQPGRSTSRPLKNERPRMWPTMRHLEPAQGHTHGAKPDHRHLRKTQEVKEDSTGGCR